jgi:hypothetical protein
MGNLNNYLPLRPGEGLRDCLMRSNSHPPQEGRAESSDEGNRPAIPS